MKKTAAGKIRVEMVPVGDLPAFADAELEKAGGEGLIPITPDRARAQSRNPYAAPEDLGLIVVYAGDRLVGYFGVLPGRLRIGSKIWPVYWGSTCYVSPDYRSSAAGLMLARRFKQSVPESAFTDVSPEGVKMLIYMGARRLGFLDYRVVNLRRIPPALRRALLRSAYGGLVKNVKMEEAARLELSDFAQPDSGSPPAEFHRGPEVVNWMLRDKWVAETGKESFGGNYLFSHTRDYFRHIAVKVYSARGNDYKGFAVILVSSSGGQTVLKVLDDSFASSFDRRYILPIALSYAERHRADQIQFSDELTRFLSRGSPLRLFARRKKRLYLAHPAGPDSPIARAFGDIRLKFCDGDTAFT